MKKLLSLLVVCGLLCGCSENNIKPSLTTTDASQTTTTPPFTTSTSTTNDEPDNESDIKIEIEGETVIDVVNKINTILILTEEGNVYGEGDNYHGQLATGDYKERKQRVKIDFPEEIKLIDDCVAVGKSNTVYQWGVIYDPDVKNDRTDGLIPQNQHLTFASEIHSIPFEKEIVDIDKSWDYINLLTSDGEVYTYGAYYNRDEVNMIPENRAYTDIYPTDGFQKVDIGEKALKISCGDYHTVVLGESGSVYGYGSSQGGELGFDTLNPSEIYKFSLGFKCIDIAGRNGHSFFLSDTGDVYAIGYFQNEKELVKSELGNITEMICVPSNQVYFIANDGKIMNLKIAITDSPFKEAFEECDRISLGGVYQKNGNFYITADAKNLLAHTWF